MSGDDFLTRCPRDPARRIRLVAGIVIGLLVGLGVGMLAKKTLRRLA